MGSVGYQGKRVISFLRQRALQVTFEAKGLPRENGHGFACFEAAIFQKLTERTIDDLTAL